MKKELLSKVMKRAWAIKREDSRNIFSLCLKMAWKEVEAVENNTIDVVEIFKKMVSDNVGVEVEEKLDSRTVRFTVNVNKEVHYSIYSKYCNGPYRIKKGSYNSNTKSIEIKAITVATEDSYCEVFEKKVSEKSEIMLQDAYLTIKKFLEAIDVPFLKYERN